MGRSKLWFYSDAKKMVQRYNTLEWSQSMYAVMSRYAVDRAFERISNLENGDSIRECIEMVLINKTHDAQGAARNVYVSKRTVERWISFFIKTVAEEAGIFSEGS